jgi:glyoxylase-like metal-dependent hydrolase (beta-lactamase superfamily II)
VVEPQQLTESIYYFNSYPSCGMVVTPAGVVAVDGPMRPSQAYQWRDFIRGHGTLKYQIVCEHHQDHVASGWFLEPEAIITSEVTASEFGKSLVSCEAALQTFAEYDPAFETAYPEVSAGYEIRQPDIVYRDRLSFTLGGHRFVVFMAPGHTRGNSVVHAVDDRVAFVADLFGLAFHSSDVWSWLRTLGTLEALDVDWYVVGHGTPVRRDYINEVRAQLLATIERAREVKKLGMTREEFIRDGATILGKRDRRDAEYPERMAKRRGMLQERGLGTLYDYLDEHPSGAMRPHQDEAFPILF